MPAPPVSLPRWHALTIIMAVIRSSSLPRRKPMSTAMASEPGLPFSPSLNQAILARLPGLPAVIIGTRAVEWLSSMGIARRMTARGMGGGLAPVPAGEGMAAILAAPPFPLRLDAMVEDSRPDALELADDVGTALAALIATLVLGPADARKARPDWPAGHWARWAAVRRLVVGGGLMTGSLGRRVMATATDRLPCLGVVGVNVLLAEDPPTLVLRGAAAGLPDGPAVLLDAGQTSVKSALAEVAGGRPGRLRLAAPVSSSTVLELRGARLAERLAEIALGTVAAECVTSCGLAVATYTDPAGQPFPGQASAYGSLAEVRLAEYLAGRLAEGLRFPVQVRAGGDGAASAAAVRGFADAAIVLGTAIGWGLNV
jgi:hypothetical protein